MAPSTCSVITTPPRILPSLSEALERLHGSYHATETIIQTWSILLVVRDDRRSFTQHRLWQRVLALLRNPTARSIYRDPESLQVAQVLARMDPAQVLSELGVVKVGDAELHGVHRRIEGYSSVSCLQNWIIQCAMLSLRQTRSSKWKIAWLHLTFLGTPQPVYEGADLQRARNGEDMSSLRVTGSDGALMPILTKFVGNWNADVVRSLLRLITRIAMDVADIYDYTRIHAHRKKGEHPPLRWYYLGLLQARAAFISAINECANAMEDVLPLSLRVHLKSVPFVVIWDWLWEEAQMVCTMETIKAVSLHARLYNFVVLSLANPEPWPFSVDNLERMQGIAFPPGEPYWEFSLALWSPKPWRPSGYPRSINCERIENTEAHRMEYHWGRQFYGDDLPPGFSTNQDTVDAYLAELHPEREDPADEVPAELLRNIYDTADLETYGPVYVPRVFAKVAVGIEIPEEQNCTICAENFEWWNTRNACLKLRGCGHYFHEECLRQWINGVAANSNLCPECRAEICSDRRPVRVKGTPGAPLSDVMSSSDHEPALELNEELELEDQHEEVAEVQDRVPSPPVYVSELPNWRESQYRSPDTIDERNDLGEGVQPYEVPERDYRSAAATEDPENDEDPTDAGYALSDADNTETFQPAGLTYRPISPIYVRPEETMDSEGNRLPGRWTWRTHRPEPETAFEYDMEKDEDEDDYEYPIWATGIPEDMLEPSG
ncbi:hypothetical protein BDU57DRAFT_172169 [Ampelomyces quisqualis]|uniref:RING-type domain-containing protein n=1 Tax=Ampelomyces quisqualis TaxID=50730 RepID=A0A6A5QQJ1_AMPQU|nr:hypothetical protein BDU57DRAFT_172169 [Ampelomyces quisqualis]